MAKVSHTHKHTAQNINIRSNFGTIYSGFFSFLWLFGEYIWTVDQQMFNTIHN